MSWACFECPMYVQFVSCVQVVLSDRTRKNNSKTKLMTELVRDYFENMQYTFYRKSLDDIFHTPNKFQSFRYSKISLLTLLSVRLTGIETLSLAQSYRKTRLFCIIIGSEFMDNECIKLLGNCFFFSLLLRSSQRVFISPLFQIIPPFFESPLFFKKIFNPLPFPILFF